MRKSFLFFTMLILHLEYIGQCAHPNLADMNMESLNMRTRFTNGGALWGLTTKSEYGLGVPKLSMSDIVAGMKQKKVIFGGGIFLSAVKNGQILNSSVRYAGNTGFAFAPGPIKLSTGSVSGTSCSLFDKVFYISKFKINKHLWDLKNQGAPVVVYDSLIIKWPARGNKFYATYSIEDDLAPFVDINKNNIYEPELGDYPKIKGDEAYFTILNDLGITEHDSVNRPLGVEIHLMAYTVNSTALKNTIFYEAKVNKKTQGSIDSFIFSLFVDPDVGSFRNDYTGCDTLRNMAFAYNAESFDQTTISMEGYGNLSPIPTTRFINRKMTSFCHYFLDYNNLSFQLFSPKNINEYRNAMKGLKPNGTPYYKGGSGLTGTIPASYVFPGNPSNSSEWSMANLSLASLDISYLQNTAPITLNYNSPEQYNFKVSVHESTSIYTFPPNVKDSILPKEDLILNYYNDSILMCNLKITSIKITSDTNNLGKGKIELTVTNNNQDYLTIWSNNEIAVNSITGKKAGSYTVTLVDVNKCSKDTTLIIPNKSVSGGGGGGGGVAIQEINLLAAISIFPNPFQENLVISCPESIQMDAIKLYDLQGRLLKSILLNAKETSVDLTLKDIAAGSYMIEVITDQCIKMQRVNKE